jgi:hypothetical protein
MRGLCVRCAAPCARVPLRSARVPRKQTPRFPLRNAHFPHAPRPVPFSDDSAARSPSRCVRAIRALLSHFFQDLAPASTGGKHGALVRKVVQPALQQAGDAHSDGGPRCCRKDDHPVQAQARRGRHDHPHNRCVFVRSPACHVPAEGKTGPLRPSDLNLTHPRARRARARFAPGPRFMFALISHHRTARSTQASTSRASSTRTSASPCGTSEGRTRSAPSGGTTTRTRRASSS